MPDMASLILKHNPLILQNLAMTGVAVLNLGLVYLPCFQANGLQIRPPLDRLRMNTSGSQ